MVRPGWQTPHNQTLITFTAAFCYSHIFTQSWCWISDIAPIQIWTWHTRWNQICWILIPHCFVWKNLRKMLVKRMTKVWVLQTFFVFISKQISVIFTASQGSWQQCEVYYQCEKQFMMPFLRGGSDPAAAFSWNSCTGNTGNTSFVQKNAFVAILGCPLSVQMPPRAEEATSSLAAAVFPGASTSSSFILVMARPATQGQ